MSHIHEKIDFTTSVFVVHGDAVLFHKHKRLGIWLQPGGHIELHEDPTEAAVREVKEETGLDVALVGNPRRAIADTEQLKDLIPPKFMSRHFYDGTHTHEHIDLVYFARAGNRDVRPEDGVGEFRWLTTEELERGDLDIVPAIREYALAALEELGD